MRTPVPAPRRPAAAMAIAALWLLGGGCDQAASAEPSGGEGAPEPAETRGEPQATEIEEPAEGRAAVDDDADDEPVADDGPGLDPRGRFLGERDIEQRRALATEPVEAIELGTGGRSVAFKITLADGTQGYYKPEQTFSAAHWYAEVAAYHLDRALGIGRAPPAVGRRMQWAPLEKVARHHRRLGEVVVQEDGTVRGAFIWWIPGGLDPIEPGVGWERWIRQNGGLAITPFQRPYGWKADLESFRDTGEAPEPPEDEAAPPKGPPDLTAAISDMILFDYLTRNVDRWGGRGGKLTNVRTHGEDGPLIFLDNGAGFGPGRHRIGYIDAKLRALQKFRRSTVEAIRELDLDDLRDRMAKDPLAPVLPESRWEGLEERRAHLLEHVEAVRERYGRDAVFPW